MIFRQGSESQNKCLWAESLSCKQCVGTSIVAALATITLLAGVLLILAQNGYNLGGIGTIAHQIGPQLTYVGMGIAGTFLFLDIAFIVALVRRPSATPPPPHTPLSTPPQSPYKHTSSRRTLDRYPSTPRKLNQPDHLQASTLEVFQTIPLLPGQYMTANCLDATTNQMTYPVRFVSWQDKETLLPFQEERLQRIFLSHENIRELVNRRLCDAEVQKIAEKENLSSRCDSENYWECTLTIGDKSIPAAIFYENGNFPYLIWKTTKDRESYFAQAGEAAHISFDTELSEGDFPEIRE